MKLSISTLAILGSLAVSAATFKWNADLLRDGFKSGDSGYSPAMYSGTAYLVFTADLTQADFWAKNVSASTIGTYSSNSKAVSSGSLAGDVAEYATTKEEGETEEAYFVIFDSYKDQNYVYMSSLANADVKDVGSGTFAFGFQTNSNQIGSQEAGKWNAISVPEPTSGMLMLLGFAGLALRRKQRKA